MALTKLERRSRIKMRVRKVVYGTKDKPRFSVFRSNKQIYAQFIDEAKVVGKLAAEKAKEGGIIEVVFDRNGYLYHGRIKALAEAAREGGLKF